MSALGRSHLDRILGHLDDLDSVNLTNLVQRLVRERQLLETIFNTIQEGVLVINSAGRIDYTNQAANRLLGIKEEDIGRLILWKLVPELASTLDISLDETQHQTATAIRDLEISYPEKRFVRIYLVPFVEDGAEGIQQRFTLIISDTTEDKLSTEELIENEKLSSIFTLAAGVAHEIGNPLNSINIHLQLMERQLEARSDDETYTKLRKSVDICVHEVQRLDAIVTHFLKAIRHAPPDFQEVGLFKVLSEVIAFMAEELKDLGIQVELTMSDELPVVLADRDQVKQIFFNVLKNAMEAMDHGGKITITASSDDEGVTLRVRDTGSGISEDNLARVFQPYFTTKASGHGLGMMLVQRFMREHGGTLGVDSEPEIGTVVTLQFPQKSRRVRLLEDDS